MQMVRHDNEGVQLVGSRIAVVLQFGYDDVGRCGYLEQGGTLRRLGGNEEGATWCGAMLKSCHDTESSAAEAGLWPGFNVGAEAPTP